MAITSLRVTERREIYDSVQFLEPERLGSLIIDSSWGLLGTTLANASNINNLIAAPSSYRGDMSRQQNRQVYDRGFYLKETAAFTAGNVISNMQTASRGDPRGLLKHETVHVTQNRIFGPFYQTTYAGWGALCGRARADVSAIHQAGLEEIRRRYGVFNNPWERWGYAHSGTDTDAGKLAW